MSYESLLIGILVITLLVIAAYHVVSTDKPGRKLWRDEHGKLIAIGERQPTVPGSLRGRGAETSAPLQLAAGSYRIDYQFDGLTRLALIGAGDDETLLIKSGAGSAGFEVAEAGRYSIRVEPADADAMWRVAYRRTGN